MQSPAVLLHANPNHFRSLEHLKMECAVKFASLQFAITWVVPPS